MFEYIAAFIFCVLSYLSFEWLTSPHVKHYSNDKMLSDDQMPKHSSEIIRDGYSKKKIPKDIDVIVIGSGMGGLTCAGLLSKAGKRVLVLEQHYIAGGCTHSFIEHGFEFDTGLHYMGNVHKRKKILDLITEKPIEWDQMGTAENGYVYDEIRVGIPSEQGVVMHEFDLPAGRDNFVRYMIDKFPDEAQAIMTYINMVEKAASDDLYFNSKIIRSTLLARIVNHMFIRDFYENMKKSAKDVVHSLTNNVLLRAALLGQFGDYGQLPSEASFYIHAAVVNHYLNGGFYPRGGSTEFAKQIIPTIERTGGRCLVRKGVQKIMVKKGKVCGVKMENGDEISASTVVSACGATNTFKRLLDEHHVSKSLLGKIDKQGNSCSMVYLFVGLNGTPQELGLRSANIWHNPHHDYDAMIETFYDEPFSEPMPLFIGFPCAKDSDWTNRFPNKSNAVILTTFPYADFKNWEHLKMGKRGQDYEYIKAKFEARILQGLFEYYPQLESKVEFTMVGSPLTFNHYIGSTEGEVYGMKNSVDRFCKDDWLRPQTEIPGLFLTGQDVTTLGITGAMMGGVLTAHAVLGYGTITDLIFGRNLIVDLMKQNGIN